MILENGLYGNTSPSEGRPIHRSKAAAAVREVVKSWAGRTLHVQATGDLGRALKVLAAHEDDLASHSPHALRLLQSLREELAKRPTP